MFVNLQCTSIQWNLMYQIKFREYTLNVTWRLSRYVLKLVSYDSCQLHSIRSNHLSSRSNLENYADKYLLITSIYYECEKIIIK